MLSVPANRTLSTMAAIVFGGIFLQGCVTAPITEQNASQVYEKFSTGNIHLSTSITTTGNNIWFMNKMYDFAIRRDWENLSKTVIQANSGDDVGYFYLGLAAEGLGFKQAAQTYYILSIETINAGIPPSQCSTRGHYFAQGCHGIRLPNDAQVRLRNLK